MPFTLEQLDFLGVHLGVVIPAEFIENKRRAEEFKTRRETVGAEAGGKPDGWPSKAKFETLLKRADDAAEQNQFAPALKLLDEAQQLLHQPDSAAMPPALPVWREAKDVVDAQLDLLYGKLKRVGLPVFEQAANQIEGVLAGYRTSLVAALTEYDGAAGDAKEAARAKALKVVLSYQENIPKDKHIRAADNNPFGVEVTICDTLGAALAGLNQQLSSV
jgi:hypothetical protein